MDWTKTGGRKQEDENRLDENRLDKKWVYRWYTASQLVIFGNISIRKYLYATFTHVGIKSKFYLFDYRERQ